MIDTGDRSPHLLLRIIYGERFLKQEASEYSLSDEESEVYNPVISRLFNSPPSAQNFFTVSAAKDFPIKEIVKNHVYALVSADLKNQQGQPVQSIDEIDLKESIVVVRNPHGHTGKGKGPERTLSLFDFLFFFNTLSYANISRIGDTGRVSGPHSNNE